MKKIPTTQELKVFWNNFQRDYVTFMEMNTLNLSTIMYNSSNIFRNNGPNKNRKIILEAGCGGGTALEYLLHQLHRKEIEADVWGTDLSPNMLDFSYNRLKNINYINMEYIQNNNENNSEEKKVYEKINNNAKINLYLKEADNENMDFEENKFDVIVASLSLHLVNDPLKMLKEFKRILKPDALAYYSIWGRPENCITFTVIPNNLKKAGIILPNNRSNFHLSNEEILKENIDKAGITNYKIMKTFIPFDFEQGKEFDFMMNGPSFSELFKECPPEKQEEVKKNIVDDLDAVIKSHEFLGMEAFILRTAKF